MPLSAHQKIEIKTKLEHMLDKKLETYGKDTTTMPFLIKITQNPQQVAAYSFIQSISTSLGMSIFQQVSQIIAKPRFDEAEINHKVLGTISDEENAVISRIVQDIKRGTVANKDKEIVEVLSCSPKTNIKSMKKDADVFLRKGDMEYYIEVKTAKPNMDVFSVTKEKLLLWVALRKKPVTTILAIPYNPYYPEPYTHFALGKLWDSENELYIGERYWDFLGGPNTYAELLQIFDEVGKNYKDRVQSKINDVANNKMKV